MNILRVKRGKDNHTYTSDYRCLWLYTLMQWINLPYLYNTYLQVTYFGKSCGCVCSMACLDCSACNIWSTLGSKLGGTLGNGSFLKTKSLLLYECDFLQEEVYQSSLWPKIFRWRHLYVCEWTHSFWEFPQERARHWALTLQNITLKIIASALLLPEMIQPWERKD